MFHAQIAPDMSVEPRRRDARLDLAAAVAVRAFGETAVDARLVNLSTNGFMARTDAVIAPGSRVWLTLPAAGRVSALVIWAKGGRLGGSFAEPIDPLAVFEAAGLTRT